MTIAAAVGLVILLGAGAAPTGAASDPGREAVTILRAVNTAQAQISHPTGAYGSLGQVLGSPAFKEIFGGTSSSDSATAIVGKRTLVLVASDDRTHYQAMVMPSETCGVSVFTNETGLIYTGRALGCDQQP